MTNPHHTRQCLPHPSLSRSGGVAPARRETARVVAARLPESLPTVGFFAGLEGVDAILLVDALPHRRRTAATRIQLPAQRISIPVIGGSHSLVSELCLVPGQRWRRKLLAAIDHAHAGFPFHDVLRPDIAAAVKRAGHLVELNLELLGLILRALRLRIPVIRQSTAVAGTGRTSTTPPWPQSRPLGAALGEIALACGFNIIRLAPTARVPAGLVDFCGAHPLRVEQSDPPPASGIPEDLNVYTLLAQWGPDAAHQIRPWLTAPCVALGRSRPTTGATADDAIAQVARPGRQEPSRAAGQQRPETPPEVR